MRVVIAGILGIALIFLAFQIYSFSRKAGVIEADRAALQAQIQAAQKDRVALEAEEKYSKQEGNLEKELRARFNLKKPGEKVIIIVPHPSSSVSSSTGQ